MPQSTRFTVFGEPVEVLVSSSETERAYFVMTQVSPPGGGPPPHMHQHEDEIFTVLQGEYEIFDGKHWHKLSQGETAHKRRGSVHTFRNCGTTEGRLQIVIVPGGGMEDYLRAISVLKMPEDLARLTKISDAYGIRFIVPEPPTPSL